MNNSKKTQLKLEISTIFQHNEIEKTNNKIPYITYDEDLKKYKNKIYKKGFSMGIITSIFFLLAYSDLIQKDDNFETSKVVTNNSTISNNIANYNTIFTPINKKYISEWTENHLTNLFNLNSSTSQETLNNANIYFTPQSKTSFMNKYGYEYINKLNNKNLSLHVLDTQVIEKFINNSLYYEVTTLAIENWTNKNNDLIENKTVIIRTIVKTYNKKSFIDEFDVI